MKQSMNYESTELRKASTQNKQCQEPFEKGSTVYFGEKEFPVLGLLNSCGQAENAEKSIL